ncbi:MAG: TonB-dependent receptor [Bacteroidia bacterium]|nr:TonB-dependent receptor [Bacteroidia bacterium]
MRHLYLITACSFFFVSAAFAQTNPEPSKTITLDSVVVEGVSLLPDISRLEPVQNTFIFSGKKNEVVNLLRKDVALTEKYGRQIFSKIPGVFVYDMDGTGNQINISTRGLDPHRGWEFNIRKDGVITNTDMYGYPASHYNIPMEAVSQIELVRGTGSLQYGAQFGGMLNYISKKPSAQKMAFESINTIGSYGLVSTYNSVSGTLKKFSYYVWVNKKSSEGYRQNSQSQYEAANVSLFYNPSKNLQLKLEWTHSDYLIRLAGPLTDSMFYADPQSSTRSRNYYNPHIHIPSFVMDWKITPSTEIKFTTSAVLGARNSVMFDKPATIPDSFVTATQQYNHRQVDIDNYRSLTSELRLLQTYKFIGKQHALAAGIQYMNNDLHRRQQGKGTTGSDYDLSLAAPGWGRDLHFKTSNFAFFAENRWVLGKGFSLNTGLRAEMGESNMSGTTVYYPERDLPHTIRHVFPLWGINAEYAVNSQLNFYAGASQAYRPVIFKDIIPASIYEYTDRNLKDAFGYNMEAGFRGSWKFFSWDITAFRLLYNQRIGTLAETDSAGNLTLFRTNIGDSETHGLEIFVQGVFPLNSKTRLTVFTSTAWMNARYKNATIRTGNQNVSIDGHKVESVPAWISRNGLTFEYGLFSMTALHSYTAQSFSDAINTVTPSASGATGIVPAYHLLDMNLSWTLSRNISLKLNGNNIFNQYYFTKRPQFYPGPGIWSSDGRTFSATVVIKI